MSQKPLKSFNGPAILVRLYRAAEPEFRLHLLNKIKGIAPDLARLLEFHELVFADFLRLTPQSMQAVLRQTPEDLWVLAWPKVPKIQQRYVLQNMSAERRMQFALRCREKKPRNVAESYRAQQELAKLTKTLLEKGQISIRSRLMAVR